METAERNCFLKLFGLSWLHIGIAIKEHNLQALCLLWLSPLLLLSESPCLPPLGYSSILFKFLTPSHLPYKVISAAADVDIGRDCYLDYESEETLCYLMCDNLQNSWKSTDFIQYFYSNWDKLYIDSSIALFVLVVKISSIDLLLSCFPSVQPSSVAPMENWL